MGSRGGGFLSLVVANGAIYNRIVIPGKTQLLTPHRGARQDRGNLAQSPLSFPAGEGANGEELERGSLSEHCPLPWLEGPANTCAPPDHRPFPCPARLCFPPLGSISWLRMPGLLRMVLRQDTGGGGDGMVLLVALPRDTQPVPLWGCLAEPCKPCRASSALLSLPPAPILLQPAFFLRGFGTRAESRASLVWSPLPLPGSSRDTLSWTQRSPTAPASSTQSLMLVPVSCVLSLNQSCHLAWFFVVLLLSGSKKQILTHFPRPWDFSQPHTSYPCHSFLGT